MAQKTIWLAELGELTLSKRRGTKNLRLSVTSSGKIRVGLPAWAPYSVGINFAKNRVDWINKHKLQSLSEPLGNGTRIGKSHRLEYDYQPLAAKTSARLSPGLVKITSNLPLSDPSVQNKSVQAAERALRKEAEVLLPKKLEQLAAANGYVYKTVRIKKLTSRWGSCSNNRTITLSIFLMQLPWQLIDYVLLHELVHTQHLNHGQAFWQDFERVSPGAKELRKQIKTYRPILSSSSRLWHN